MDNMLSLIQICDSNFPTGSFSHSFGLETYIQENIVTNKEDLSKWLEVYIKEQLVYTDGLGCRLAYEALGSNNIEYIWKLDHMLTSQTFAQETRDGIRRIGERLLILGNQLYPSHFLSAYMEKVNNKKCYGHPAIVFAMMSHYLNISKDNAVLSYLFSSVTSLIQNAVRGIPLGQTDGQHLIKESQSTIMESWEIIKELTEEDLGITLPGIEIAQMRHESLNIRIFMS